MSDSATEGRFGQNEECTPAWLSSQPFTSTKSRALDQNTVGRCLAILAAADALKALPQR